MQRKQGAREHAESTKSLAFSRAEFARIAAQNIAIFRIPGIVIRILKSLWCVKHYKNKSVTYMHEYKIICEKGHDIHDKQTKSKIISSEICSNMTTETVRKHKNNMQKQYSRYA